MRYKQMYDLLRLVLAVWNQVPELRLGQLILNALENDKDDRPLYYIPDNELADVLRDYSAEIKKARHE